MAPGTRLLLFLLASAGMGCDRVVDRDDDGIPSTEDCDDDDPDATGQTTWYTDGDADGHGDPEAEAALACAAPTDQVAAGDDCDDTDPAIHPGAHDGCTDLIDDDCDDEISEDCETVLDLFDIEAIQDLTLEDLGWELVETVVGDEVTAQVGTWSGGVWPAISADGDFVDVDIASQAVLYLPTDWPETEHGDEALVYGVHYAENTESAFPAVLAAHYGIPVLYHGELVENWRDIGYLTREGPNHASTVNVIEQNLCDPTDYVRGNYRWSMAHTDLRAITLAQRLAEAAGGTIESVALRGFSKEGGAAWLALLVDPRIEVAAPGGYPAQNPLDMPVVAEAAAPGPARSTWRTRVSPTR